MWRAGVSCVVVALTMSGSAQAKSWYVDGAVGSSGDGQSWGAAWKALSNIDWGSVASGDTVFIAAGAYAALTVGAAGNSSSQVTIRASQDTHTGIATFTSISYGNRSYVTIDGGFAGSRNFSTTGTVTSATGPTLHRPIFMYVTVLRTSGGDAGNANDMAVDFRWAANPEIAYNYINIVGSNHGTPISMIAAQHPSAYGQGSVHHNTLIVPARVNDGTGPDGIQIATGIDFHDNTVQSVLNNSYAGSQHQDLVQAYGDDYLRVYNNTFIDGGDSQFDFSTSGSGSSRSHLYFYNNLLVRTIDGMGTVGLRIYSAPGSLGALGDIHVLNNTFVDCARTTASYGSAMRVMDASSTAYSNVEMKNNIFHNCGRGWPAVLIEGKPSGWDGAHNLVSAGVAGNTDISGMPNVGGQSSAPLFVAYTAYDIDNDYHLSATDTAAQDHGTSLSAAFTTDKDGVSRPQGGAWDIGAFETSVGGGGARPASPRNLRVIP